MTVGIQPHAMLVTIIITVKCHVPCMFYNKIYVYIITHHERVRISGKGIIRIFQYLFSSTAFIQRSIFLQKKHCYQHSELKVVSYKPYT